MRIAPHVDVCFICIFEEGSELHIPLLCLVDSSVEVLYVEFKSV